MSAGSGMGAVQLTLIAVAFLMPLASDFALSRVLQATMTLTPEFPRISAVGRVLVSLIFAKIEWEGTLTRNLRQGGERILKISVQLDYLVLSQQVLFRAKI